MPREYQNSSGQIVLDYAKAIQESVFEQLRVVRDGQLRLVFSQPDLKVNSRADSFIFSEVIIHGQLRPNMVFNAIIRLIWIRFVSIWQIVSWEFCARRHEELIPRRLLIPQVNNFTFQLPFHQCNCDLNHSLVFTDSKLLGGVGLNIGKKRSVDLFLQNFLKML